MSQVYNAKASLPRTRQNMEAIGACRVFGGAGWVS
jgi:hypothetical protein